MLVYANYLNIRGDGATDAVFRAIGGWLKEQLGFGLHPDQLKQDGKYRGTRSDAPSWLRIYATSEELPNLYAWVLKNSDATVWGRQWVTELGVKVTGDALNISCVVRTEESSTLIDEPTSASQPRVIPYVLRKVRSSGCAEFAPGVPSSTLKKVGQDIDSYRGLLADIERRDRDYPIVLVSPTTEQKYLLKVTHLREKLFGLAQVVQVTSDFNSYEMEEILSQKWSAWNGAINVLHTPTQKGYVRGRLFLTETIENWGATQHDRISQILAWVTNNTNIPHHRLRIRPEGVFRLAMRRRLEAGWAKVAENDMEQIKEELKKAIQLAEEHAEWSDELDKDNDRLDTDLRECKVALEDARRELWDKENTVQGLKDQLSSAGSARTTAHDVDKLIDLACRNGRITPLECLDVVQSIHGDKCVILEGAWKKAADMNRFIHGRRLLSLLIKLVKDYRTALMDGGGDSQAKKCFGKNEFAARESETVVENRAMREARTFEYQGKPVQMLRHLKIGMDDDETKTIRVHFHWDGEQKKIVIGYCGPHLPVSTH